MLCKFEKSYESFIDEGILMLDLEGGMSLVGQRGESERDKKREIVGEIKTFPWAILPVQFSTLT